MSDKNVLNLNGVVCAILTGRAESPSKAQLLVKAAETCPYVALYTARGSTVVGVFTLPKHSQEWIEYPKQQPFILGLEDVVTVVSDEIIASSPWSRGLAEGEDEVTPCGKDCKDCPEYRVSCLGCPATIFYYAAE